MVAHALAATISAACLVDMAFAFGIPANAGGVGLYYARRYRPEGKGPGLCAMQLHRRASKESSPQREVSRHFARESIAMQYGRDPIARSGAEKSRNFEDILIDDYDVIPIQDSHTEQNPNLHGTLKGSHLKDLIDKAPIYNGPVGPLKAWFAEYLPSVEKREARLWLLAVVLLSGVNFGVIKLVDDAFDGPTIMTLRFVIAFLALSPWATELRRDRIVVGTETGLWLAAGYAAQQISLSGSTDAGVAAFFASLSSVVCPFIEKCTGVQLSSRAWIAAALAVAGAGVLELGNGGLRGDDLFALLQPILFGTYLFRTEAAMHKFPKDSMGITSIQIFICAIVSIVWNFMSPGDSWSAIASFDVAQNIVPLLAMLWMGLMSTAFVLAVETVIVAKLSSSETALMFSTEPVWAAAMGSLFLGEHFGVNGYVGGALSIAACLTRSAPNLFDAKVQVKISEAFKDKWFYYTDADEWQDRQLRRAQAREFRRTLAKEPRDDIGHRQKPARASS